MESEKRHCPASGPTPGRVLQPSDLTMTDHYAITKHLRDLSNEDLMDLGGALGLCYSHLRNMCRPLLGEMVAAWLKREDNVLSATGEPSWASLVQALTDIHQLGIAKDISDGIDLIL